MQPREQRGNAKMLVVHSVNRAAVPYSKPGFPALAHAVAGPASFLLRCLQGQEW